MAKAADKRILVVDDEPDVRNFLATCIEDAGFFVETAGDGVEALEKLDASVTVVFVDIKMPVMDGIELVKEIRKRGSSVPILMITTESAQERIDEAKSAGANGYMVKPFTSAKIQKQLNDILRN